MNRCHKREKPSFLRSSSLSALPPLLYTKSNSDQLLRSFHPVPARQILRVRGQMFPISIYTGGAVENGPLGATYKKPPSASYPAQDDMTFDDLKQTIFQLTGIKEDQNSINVNARWNAGTGGSHCFVVLPICDNTMWRMLVEKTLSSATGWTIVELFVEAVPNSGCDPGEKSQSNIECAETTPTPTPQRRKSIQERKERTKNLQELSDDESIDIKLHDETALYGGRLFDSLDDLKRAVREYHIIQNRKLVTVQSSSSKYIVKCMASNCGWKLYAVSGKDGDYFQIRTIKGEHVCSNITDGEDHVNMSSEFICQLILDLIRKKGDASPKEV